MLQIPSALRELLIENGRRQRGLRGTRGELDFEPVLKLFTPDAGATWLLTEIDPEDPDIAFGLCDLGAGFPELGYVDLAEIGGVRGPLGLAVEIDAAFTATKTLSKYAKDAQRQGRIQA